MSPAPTRTPQGLAGLDFPVVLYDGQCGFCDASIMWCVDRDGAGALHFAPQESAMGRALLRELGLEALDGDSVVLVEGGEAYLRSEAGLRIARHLRAPWRWLAWWLLWIPRSLRDAVYSWIAARRYHLAGRLDRCRMPDPRWRDRFHLDP